MPALSPLTFLVFFFYMQYGPQSLIQSWLKLATDPPELHNSRFLIAIILSNVMIALGIWLSSGLINRKNVVSLPRVTMLVQTGHQLTTLLIFAICYSIVFIALDDPSLPRLRENLLFYFQSSAHSYTEIRRQLFADSLLETVMSYTRQSSTALLVCLLAVSASRTTGILRMGIVSIALTVFAVCALQLNKFPIVYSLLSAGLAVYLFKTDNYNLNFGRSISFALLVPILGILLYLLYSLQYQEAISSGYIDENDVLRVLFYRPFMAQSDALRLWFEEFPDKTPHLGILNIALLANLVGLEPFNVTTHIPLVYLGVTGTSFQAGFIGSGYASFGYLGIGLYGILLGVIGVLASNLLGTIVSRDLRAVYCGVMCLNMYFLFSREFSTALLSGGILPTAGIVLFVNYLQKTAALRHGMPIQRSGR